MRIGLALARKDLPRLAAERLDIILVPAGFSLPEDDVARITGCVTHNLNRFVAQGAIAPASRQIAPVIRQFMSTVVDAPIEAIASQNDLYQYHLRQQFFFLKTLQEALTSIPQPVLILVHEPYGKYWSPMRPDIGRLHQHSRIYALLAVRLAAKLRIPVEKKFRHSPVLEYAEVFFRSVIRSTLIEGYRLWKLAAKCLRARADARHHTSRVAGGDPCQPGPIGIVVRTDSEVLSALPLCRELERRRIPYLVIQDELLGSQTTRSRLLEVGLPFISIGAMSGLTGLLRALLTKPRKIKYAPPSVPPSADAALATISERDIWDQLADRLLDYSLDQTHFALELRAIIDVYRPRCLVTYAYVDQWGPVIQECGRKHGLKTVAVQNAALDPEEYPRLNWADHFCVESLAVKQQLMTMEYPESLLTATGLPQFAGNLPESVCSAAERLSNRTILILTQPIYPELFDKIIRTCAQVAKAQGLKVVIKLHPRQDNTDYQSAIAYGRTLAPIDVAQREPLDTMLNEATVAVSVVSAALFRAIFLGVPTFSQLPIEEHHLDLYYVRHPVTRTVNSHAALGEELSAFLEDYVERFNRYLGFRNSYLAEHAVFEPTPDPTTNIADVIVDHLESHHDCPR